LLGFSDRNGLGSAKQWTSGNLTAPGYRWYSFNEVRERVANVAAGLVDFTGRDWPLAHLSAQHKHFLCDTLPGSVESVAKTAQVELKIGRVFKPLFTGLKPQDRVVIYADTKMEWQIAAQAAFRQSCSVVGPDGICPPSYSSHFKPLSQVPTCDLASLFRQSLQRGHYLRHAGPRGKAVRVDSSKHSPC
jgi:hypothetical protein